MTHHVTHMNIHMGLMSMGRGRTADEEECARSSGRLLVQMLLPVSVDAASPASSFAPRNLPPAALVLFGVGAKCQPEQAHKSHIIVCVS